MRYMAVLFLFFALLLSGCEGTARIAAAEMPGEIGIPEAAAPADASAGRTARGSFRNVDFTPARKDISLGDDMKAADAAAEERQIVYTAWLQLRVANTESALERISAIVKDAGGFVASSSLTEVVFRVSPTKFETTIKELEALGEVTQRQINSSDVTDQYTDLKLRLDVAMKSRDRLVDLMERVDQTKDILEVERDLRRLTEEIEQIEGQMRKLKDQVAMSTITVRLEKKSVEAITPQLTAQQSPFFWIRYRRVDWLMDPMDTSGYIPRHFFLSGPEFRLGHCPEDSPAPEGFVPLVYTRSSLVADTARGARLSVNVFDPRRSASMTFWNDALKNQLVDKLGYELVDENEVSAEDNNLSIRHLATKVDFGGEVWLYDVWFGMEADEDDGMITIEYARPARFVEDAENTMSAVTAAVAGLEL